MDNIWQPKLHYNRDAVYNYEFVFAFQRCPVRISGKKQIRQFQLVV